MIHLSSGEYTLMASVGAVPSSFSECVKHAILYEQAAAHGTEGTLLCFAVSRGSSDWPELALELRFQPGPEAGFHPGFLLIPESGVLLVGAGMHILAYGLSPVRRISEDVTEAGFLAWRRHGDIVIMSGELELELAGWSVQGQKLWSTFVEPPWSYEIDGDLLVLNVMGATSSFCAAIGPRRVHQSETEIADVPRGEPSSSQCRQHDLRNLAVHGKIAVTREIAQKSAEMLTSQVIRRPGDALKRIHRLLEAGNCAAAYEVGRAAILEFPGDLEIAHATVLALARSGKYLEAREIFEELQLHRAVDDGSSDLEIIEIAALDARLLKDEAFAGNFREHALLRNAADAYDRVYRATGDVYPGVNAASLWRLAGDDARSIEIAERVLKTITMRRFYGGRPDYYSYASEAEARLILGDASGSREALLLAADAPGSDEGAKASTSRQLQTLCEALGIPSELVSVLR
jgi:hypothetical protein